MSNGLTGKDLDEILQRREAYARESMLLGLCLAALSGATAGFVFGYLAHGWLS